MPARFEGPSSELPSAEQIDEFASYTLGLIHNLTYNTATSEHEGGSTYQVDDDTIVAIDVFEFRRTTPDRPDIVVAFVEFDTEEDKYTQTDITLWESTDSRLQKNTVIPYEVIECEVVVGHEELRVAVRGLSLHNKLRKNKKVPKAERNILAKLADPQFTLADYLKFRKFLSQCNETNRVEG